MMLFDDTVFPGNVRYCAAILPGGAAELSNCDVSYQPCAVVEEASGLVSQLKNAKILFFQIGPPRLPPYWLNRFSSRFNPRDAGVPGWFEPTPFHVWYALSPGRDALKNALP